MLKAHVLLLESFGDYNCSVLGGELDIIHVDGFEARTPKICFNFLRTLNIQFRYRKVGYIFNEVCSAVPKAVIHLTFCQKLILFESWCHF